MPEVKNEGFALKENPVTKENKGTDFARKKISRRLALKLLAGGAITTVLGYGAIRGCEKLFALPQKAKEGTYQDQAEVSWGVLLTHNDASILYGTIQELSGGLAPEDIGSWESNSNLGNSLNSYARFIDDLRTVSGRDKLVKTIDQLKSTADYSAYEKPITEAGSYALERGIGTMTDDDIRDYLGSKLHYPQKDTDLALGVYNSVKQKNGAEFKKSLEEYNR